MSNPNFPATFPKFRDQETGLLENLGKSDTQAHAQEECRHVTRANVIAGGVTTKAKK